VDLWDFFKVLVRRWYLTVPLLAVTAFMASNAAKGVEPTYTASVSGVFLEPAVALPADQLSPNPWAQAGVGTTASAVVDSIMNPVAQSAVVADGFSGEYTVLLASRSVLFTVYAPAPTPEEATATLNHIIDLLQEDLQEKQSQYNVPDDQQILIQITSGKSLVTTRDGLQRVVAVVAGLGVVATATFVIIVDSILTRRSRRKGEPAESDEADDPTVDPEPQPDGGRDGGPDLLVPPPSVPVGARRSGHSLSGPPRKP